MTSQGIFAVSRTCRIASGERIHRSARRLFLEDLEPRRLLTGGVGESETAFAYDVNGDGFVSPVDFLLEIEAIKERGLGDLGDDPAEQPPYLDVNGDGRLSAHDPLLVLNYFERCGGCTPETLPPATPLPDSGAVVKIRLDVADMQGDVVDSVEAGQSFQLRGWVRDLRDPSEYDLLGVFSAFVDAHYPAAMVSANQSTIPESDFPIHQPGDLTTPGTIRNAGAYANTPHGDEEWLLFSVTMTAEAAGQATFSTDRPQDQELETLVFGWDEVLSPETIEHGSITLTIHEGDSGPEEDVWPYGSSPDVYVIRPDQSTLSIPADGGVMSNDRYDDNRQWSVQLLRGPVEGEIHWRGDGSFDYTPGQEFDGYDSFFYRTVSKTTNRVSEAVEVAIVAQSQDPRVVLTVELTDSQGNAVSQAEVGDQVIMNVYIQDTADAPDGVYFAMVETLYDASLVSVAGEGTRGEFYSFQINSFPGESFAADTPGVVFGGGLADYVSLMVDRANGTLDQDLGARYLLYSLPFRADAPGEVVFATDPSNTGLDSLSIPSPGASMLRILAMTEEGPSVNLPWDQVFYGDASLEILPGENLPPEEPGPAEPLMELSLEATTLSGDPLASVELGQDFYVVVNGRGLSESAGDIFSAYFDLYIPENQVVQTGPVELREDFIAGRREHEQQPGVLNEIGGFLAPPNFVPSEGVAGQILRVPFRAISTGEALFTLDPPDIIGSDLLVFNVVRQLDPEEVIFGSLGIEIGGEPVGSAPQAADDAYQVLEDTPLNVALDLGLLANDIDPDSDALEVRALLPEHGTLHMNADGSFTYTPPANFFGQDSFTYQAFDGHWLSDPATVIIQVEGAYDPPLAVGDLYWLDEANSIHVTADHGLLANDVNPDQQVLQIELVEGPRFGDLDLQLDGSFTYAAGPNFLEGDAFTYRLRDGVSASSEASVELRLFADQDLRMTLRVQTTSIDGVPISRVEVGESFVVHVAAEGREAGKFYAIYLDLLYDQHLVSISGPLAFGDRLTEGKSGDLSTPGLIDEAGAFLDRDLSIPLQPFDGGSVFVFSAQFTAVEPGEAVFRSDPADEYGKEILMVNDPDAIVLPSQVSFESSRLQIGAESAEYNPLAEDDALSLQEDVVQRLDVLANDQGLGVSIQSVTSPANGTLSIIEDALAVRYTPNAGYFGEDSFTYTIRDQNGNTDSATVSLRIESVNDNPVAVDDQTMVEAGIDLLTIDVLSNDWDDPFEEQTLSIHDVSPAAHGEVSIDSEAGVLLYKPDARFIGREILRYEVSDGSGGFDQATLTIDVVSPWTNHEFAQDVNADKEVTALDALNVINEINQRGVRDLFDELSDRAEDGKWDVNGDGRLSALDPLNVINYLNKAVHRAAAEGEGGSRMESSPIAEAAADNAAPLVLAPAILRRSPSSALAGSKNLDADRRISGQRDSAADRFDLREVIDNHWINHRQDRLYHMAVRAVLDDGGLSPADELDPLLVEVATDFIDPRSR